METLKQIVIQELNEKRYSRHYIDGYIRDFIESSMKGKIIQGVELIKAYMSKTYYESKNKRISQLTSLDLTKLVTDLYVGIAYFLKEELFTSVSSQLASRLKFSDKTDSITTVAELIAVLCATDVFDIGKTNKQASLMVLSRIQLPERLVEFINNSHYLPPMVCEPLELTNNYSSGYLSHKDSLILGNGNHHDGDICLDVLNTMNKVALKLDTEYLCSIEEEATFKLDTPEKCDQWKNFKKQSYGIYELLANNGTFYMTHKVDKRGRIYSQGYHVNPQGSSFKKSMVELTNEELVEGVPN